MNELKKELDPVIAAAVASEQIVGTSILVVQYGKTLFEYQGGWANREDKKPVTEQTLFRLASMTKPITSAATMALLEKGILELDAPITRWLPSFTPKTPDGRIANITLRHLLTHTSGLSYGFLTADNEPYHSAGVSDGLDETVLSLQENLQRLATVPLMFNPGNSWCYSLATDVLGAILEQACQQPLPQIIEQYITRPLGMKDTTFYVQEIDRLTNAYADSIEPGGPARRMQAADQVLVTDFGPIHYAPGRITNKQAYPSGGAGMVGTARDYLRFLEAIRRGGAPILKPASVKLLTEDAVKDFAVDTLGPGCGFGMGFGVIRDSETAATPRFAGSYGWDGAYGTSMFVDPEIGLSVIMLTNTAFAREFPISVTRAIYNALPIKSSAQHLETTLT